MQGMYRLRADEGEVLESFVAAPGPAGWRYFGRVLAPSSEEEIGTVDFVVDTDWGLIRYRERDTDGGEVVVVREPEGMHVSWSDVRGESSVSVPQAEIVWSRSPCSLLVAERRARAVGVSALNAIRIRNPVDPTPLLISLDRMGDEPAPAGSGSSPVEKVKISENGRTITALIRQDLPLSAEGWFDLVA